MFDRVPDEERAIVELVTKFVDEKVRPVASELEHSDTYPDETDRPDEGGGHLRAGRA